MHSFIHLFHHQKPTKIPLKMKQQQKKLNKHKTEIKSKETEGYFMCTKITRPGRHANQSILALSD